MEKDKFDEKFNKMLALCGFTVKRETADYYFDELLQVDERTLLTAFKKMTEDPPNRMSVRAVWAFISIARKESNSGVGDVWSGAPCSVEECIMGLIHTEHNVFNGQPRYKYVWRCQTCRSNSTHFMEFFTPENVDILEKKIYRMSNPAPPQGALPPGDREAEMLKKITESMEF